MTSTTRNLLAALIVLLLSAGVALAIVQPGDLGDDESASGTSSSSSTTDGRSDPTDPPTSETTETPTTETTETTETTATPATDPPPSPTTPTTGDSAGPGSTSTTDTTAAPVPGGGLAGSGGADAVGSNIANTGGESTFYLLGAVVLAALGVLAWRVSRPAP